MEHAKQGLESIVKPTVLSLRLQAIVSLIPPSSRVLDIGTDHGQVPAYVLENHLADSVVATDIHEDPAEICRKYLRRQGVIKNATVLRTDGLHGIVLRTLDTVILSGLGGMEMVRIIRESLIDHDNSFPLGVHFLLQPQRSAEELRVFLEENGFHLVTERICIDREKMYTIILTKFTKEHQPVRSLTENILGPVILSDRPEHYFEYLSHERNVLKKHMRARPELSDVIQEIDRLLSDNQS